MSQRTRKADEKPDDAEAEFKKANEKPLSLYPLTMDEALREAMKVTPPRRDDNHQQEKTSKKNKLK